MQQHPHQPSRPQYDLYEAQLLARVLHHPAQVLPSNRKREKERKRE
jgi:hypothetical protein